MILKRNFYNHNTIKVAQDFLGCFLVRKHRGKITKAMIVETEAYRGEDDLASHASKGRSARTEIMYGEPGRAYIYLVYGMHYMLNVVTEEKDFPAAVLIRGVDVVGAIHELPLRGPGKLTKFLHINKSLNGHDLTKGEKLWIESPGKPPRSKGNQISEVCRKFKIIKSPRVGVDYAKHCKKWKWNFKAVLW